MYDWQIVLKARYYGGYEILIVTGKNIQEALNTIGRLDDIISITKILGPDD